MTQGTEQQSYRCVKCLDCKQPIPISPFVAGIEAELCGEETPSKHRKCQVFNLRCIACGKEKPYKIGEIFEFQGALLPLPQVQDLPQPGYASGVTDQELPTPRRQWCWTNA
jgi:hypothetical protein